MRRRRSADTMLYASKKSLRRAYRIGWSARPRPGIVMSASNFSLLPAPGTWSVAKAKMPNDIHPRPAKTGRNSDRPN
eukprot:571982-Heterocapsa_arctica.AAC.1